MLRPDLELTRDQIESVLAIDGWAPFRRYGKVNQLRRGNLRTTGWPPTLWKFPDKMKPSLLPEPCDWSDMHEKRLRQLFKAVYKYEEKWR